MIGKSLWVTYFNPSLNNVVILLCHIPYFLCFHRQIGVNTFHFTVLGHLLWIHVLTVAVLILFCICVINLLKFSKMSKYDMTGIGLNLREIPDDNGSFKLMVLGLLLDGPAYSAGVRQVCSVLSDEKIAFTTIDILLVTFVCSVIVLMNLDVIC